MKVCSKCSTQKPLEQFHKHKDTYDGRVGSCRVCVNAYNRKRRSTPEAKQKRQIEHKRYVEKNLDKIKESRRRAHLKSRYGISLEDYALMLESQDGKCAICKTPGEYRDDPIPSNLEVDHCHKTGKVRGLLCRKCNVALGLVDDNIKILSTMIEYVDNY